MTPPLAARPFARRTACALVIVLSAFVAREATAQERWHTQAIEPLPPGAVVDDLAFHEREGYLAVRAGDGSGHVVHLRFPDDGPPTFADAGFSGFSYLYPFVVSFHGTHVAVTTEVDAIGLLDVASGVWDLTLYAPPSTSGAVQLLEVDATGGARLLVTPQPLAGTGADLQYFDGASWLEHELGSSDDVRVALLSGDWAAGVSDDGHVYVSYDVAAPGSWQDLGALLPDLPAFPEEGSAARLDDGSVAAVLARDNGSWAVRLDGLDESAATVADCSAEVISAAPSGFRRVAASEGALHALDREGRVHRIVDPASCAGWGGGVVSPALFTDPVGLGAVSDDLALAVGHRAGDGVPLVAWRNRPPRLAPLDPVDLDEGSVTTVTVDATDPDPADADTIVVSASCDASAVEIDVSGLELTVRAGAFAQACAASSERVSCAVTASDGERSVSEGFAVNVRDVDGVVQPSPPSLTREGIAERTVPIEAAGVSVPLAVTVTDDCADENTVVWDLSALPEALLPSGSALVRDASAEASRSLVLTAPLADALGLDGVEAEVVATVEDGVAGADEVRFLLRFVIGERLADGATVELSLSAPSTRALGLGDVVRVDAALSSTLALPSLRVTLANGELAALDGSVEMAGSSCGASGSARASDDGLVIEAEGVAEGCPLAFHFLARKGLAREALRVTSCTWGPDDAVIARCAGGLSVTRERALGCAQLEGAGAGPSFGLLALVTLLARRRRGAERGVSRPRGSS